MTAAPRDPTRDIFVAELGFRLARDGEVMRGEMDVTPEMLVAATDQPRISVMATAGDVLIGQLANELSPVILLTVDLAVSLLEPIGTGPVRMESRLVKVGRTLTSGEARWTNAGGELVAYCWATFMASPRPVDATLEVASPTEVRRGVFDGTRPTISEPFTDLLGIDVVGGGVAEVERRPYVLQPTGTLQGGVVCALGEVAAESLLGSPVTSLDTRYLSGIRDGSGRATAERLADDLAVVEVVDTQRPDRVAAVIHARTASPG